METGSLTINSVDPHSSKQIGQLEKLAKEIWEQHYIPIVGADQVGYMLNKFQSAAPMKNQMDEGMLYYLAFNPHPIGYLATQPEQEYLFLSKIYVHHSQRGQGIGRKLILFAEQVAERHDKKAIRLTVNKENHNTIAFYESLGFENRRELVTDIGQGYVMDDYEMVKEI